MDLSQICRSALAANASDIHLKVGLPPLLRIDGDIRPIAGHAPLEKDALAQTLWDIMSPTQRDRFKLTNDCDLSHAIPGVGRFRCTVFRSQQRIGAVLRAIPNRVRTTEELGLPSILKQVAREPRGLVLVTGATGSGKSTTLAALIEEINVSLPHHIVTIEDPIEFVFQDRMSVVNQREVGLDTLNYHHALKAALRQDPDVILIGELRDSEAVDIALHAAETGHLVLASLHTLDAHEAISRMVNFFEPHQRPQVRYQLGSVLRAVISQRLVPATQGGRVPAVEVMLNTGTVYECIVDPTRTRELRDHIRKGRAHYGMQTFDQALYELISSGRVRAEVGLRFANNPDEVGLRLSGLVGDDD